MTSKKTEGGNLLSFIFCFVICIITQNEKRLGIEYQQKMEKSLLW